MEGGGLIFAIYLRVILARIGIAHLAGVGPETALGGEALAADVAVEGSVLQPL